MDNIIYRKFTATYVTVLFITFTLSASTVSQSLEDFFGWSFFFFIYVGAVVLIYANLVSFGIEFVLNGGLKTRTYTNSFVFIFMHVIFGVLPIFVSGLSWFLWLSIFASLLYACVDRWVWKRSVQGKRTWMIVFLPLFPLLIGLTASFFNTEPLLPFTAEEAVEYATSIEDTNTDPFPKEIGVWQGIIEDYEVTRETLVEPFEKESYIVTFEETWKRGDKEGKWFISYKVERNRLVLYDEGGASPFR